MCIANKLKKNNKYVFISCRPQKTSVLGHKSGLKEMTDPPIITQTLGVRASPLLHSSQRR